MNSHMVSVINPLIFTTLINCIFTRSASPVVRIVIHVCFCCFSFQVAPREEEEEEEELEEIVSKLILILDH